MHAIDRYYEANEVGSFCLFTSANLAGLPTLIV